MFLFLHENPVLHICPGHGDIDPDGHKDGIFTEKPFW